MAKQMVDAAFRFLKPTTQKQLRASGMRNAGCWRVASHLGGRIAPSTRRRRELGPGLTAKSRKLYAPFLVIRAVMFATPRSAESQAMSGAENVRSTCGDGCQTTLGSASSS